MVPALSVIDMVGRKPYSTETRQRVIDAYVDGRDWKAVSLALGVPFRTVNRWISDVNNSRERGRHGGHKRRILSEANIEQLAERISEDPTVTLNMLRVRLKVEYEVDVSVSTIGNCLDGQLITLKKLYPISETMNSQVNKNRRKEFVEYLLRAQDAEDYIIWIDESE